MKTCHRSIFEKYNECFTDLEGDRNGSDDGMCNKLIYNVVFLNIPL